VTEKINLEEYTLESLGQYLRQEREKAGLTRSDICSKTRITIDQIAQMEDGRQSNLPPVYARGFLRTYAATLSLNTDSIIASFRQITGQIEPVNSKPLSPKYVESDLIEEGGFSLHTLVIFIILLLVLAVGLFFISSDFRNIISPYLPFSLLNNSRPIQNPAPQNGTDSEISTSNSSSPNLQSPAVDQTSNDETGGRLTLLAEKSTWIQILVDDQNYEYYLFQPGQSRSWTCQKKINLIAGNGEALKVSWNDENRGFLGSHGPKDLVLPKNLSQKSG